MVEDVVGKEVALAEFERMCAANNIETDESQMDDAEKDHLAGIRDRLVKAMRSGALIVGPDGRPTYTPSTPGQKPITFREVTGETFLTIDSGKNDGGVHRIVRAVQQLTGSKPGTFAAYNARDFKVCTALGNLFLAQE